MKPSIYNSIIPVTKKSHLIYNSLSDAIIIFNSEHKQDILQPNILKDKQPKFYEDLVKAECYVHKDLDEFKKLKEINAKFVDNPTTYVLTVNPTMACNFKCWYCYEDHKRFSKMSPETIQNIKLFSSKTIKENPKLSSFSLSFFGGEPLMYCNSIVFPIMKNHVELCNSAGISYSVSFTSNGSLINDNLLKELSKYSNVGFQLTLDGDKTNHDKVRFFNNGKGSYELIIKNMLKLLSKEMNVRLRVNYTKETFSSIPDIIKDLKKVPKIYLPYLLLDFHQVWQDKGKNKLGTQVEEVLKTFAQEGLNYTHNSINLIRDYCYADLTNSVVVNYNGEVFKCTAKDFTSDRSLGHLNSFGEICWKKPFTNPALKRFENKPCQSCRIAPLCAGGCSNYILNQQLVNKEYCRYDHSEHEKDKVILTRFEEKIRSL
nr:radical SAM protein [uncultured Draconibacterium sp.]